MAKRIPSTAINWSGIIEKFQPEERAKLSVLKSAVDKYVREIATRPAELPKIDWNYYKGKIRTPGVVESFQKSYESLKIPYPTDQGLVAESEKFNDSFLKKCEVKFQNLQADLDKFSKELAEKEKIMPYVDMTVEEFFIARPDLKISPENPRLWPHYIEPEENGKETPK